MLSRVSQSVDIFTDQENLGMSVVPEAVANQANFMRIEQVFPSGAVDRYEVNGRNFTRLQVGISDLADCPGSIPLLARILGVERDKVLPNLQYAERLAKAILGAKGSSVIGRIEQEVFDKLCAGRDRTVAIVGGVLRDVDARDIDLVVDESDIDKLVDRIGGYDVIRFGNRDDNLPKIAGEGDPLRRENLRQRLGYAPADFGLSLYVGGRKYDVSGAGGLGIASIMQKLTSGTLIVNGEIIPAVVVTKSMFTEADNAKLVVLFEDIADGPVVQLNDGVLDESSNPLLQIAHFNYILYAAFEYLSGSNLSGDLVTEGKLGEFIKEFLVDERILNLMSGILSEMSSVEYDIFSLHTQQVKARYVDYINVLLENIRSLDYQLKGNAVATIVFDRLITELGIEELIYKILGPTAREAFWTNVHKRRKLYHNFRPSVYENGQSNDRTWSDLSGDKIVSVGGRGYGLVSFGSFAPKRMFLWE